MFTESGQAILQACKQLDFIPGIIPHSSDARSALMNLLSRLGFVHGKSFRADRPRTIVLHEIEEKFYALCDNVHLNTACGLIQLDRSSVTFSDAKDEKLQALLAGFVDMPKPPNLDRPAFVNITKSKGQMELL